MSHSPGGPASTADYGVPPTGFQNYLVAPSNPNTDWDATAAGLMISDVIQMTRTAPMARAKVTLAGASAPTIVSHYARWGGGAGVIPTAGKGGTGIATLTWAATQKDEFGASLSINFADAWAEIDDVVFGGFVRAKVTAPNVVTLYYFAFGSPPSASDLTGVTVKVFVL